jgi:hypothetical protein
VKSLRDIEETLERTPTPIVVEGAHKAQIKAQLLVQFRRQQKSLGTWQGIMSSRAAKLAVGTAALAAGVLWAATHLWFGNVGTLRPDAPRDQAQADDRAPFQAIYTEETWSDVLDEGLLTDNNGTPLRQLREYALVQSWWREDGDEVSVLMVMPQGSIALVPEKPY